MLRLNAARPTLWVATHVAGALTVAAAATVVPATEASAARTAARGAAPAAQPWPGHPDRAIVRHQVRPGDTATGLAVRYHAWTAELLRLNGLGKHGAIYQGQVLRIPIVISAVRRAGGQVPKLGTTKPAQKPAKKPKQHTKKKPTR